jgi:hypothetical protein
MKRRTCLTGIGAIALSAQWRSAFGQTPSTQRPIPALILPDLAWSLSEPIPGSAEEMLSALAAYSKSVRSTLDRKSLKTVFPRRGLDLQFSVWRRPNEGGDWKEQRLVIPLRFPSSPTYLALLLEVHKATHAHLKTDNKHFFEGLELSKSEGTDLIPTYHLRLGS